jgi:hypothetical protein
MPVLAAGRARKSLLAGAVVALALASGCGAPATVSQPQFTAMPLLDSWGAHVNYVTILGPETGTGSKTFTITARAGVGAWISCIGKGVALLNGPVTVGAACGDGSTWAGGRTQPTHWRAGQRIAVHVVAPSTTRWEFRIDGTPQALPPPLPLDAVTGTRRGGGSGPTSRRRS